MKRIYLTTVLTSLLVLLLFCFLYSRWNGNPDTDVLKIGFIYEDDESTPYTYNFALAENALTETYADEIQILSVSNVLESETEEPLRDLIRKGCRIIFTNSHSDQFLTLAPEYPEIQFCQVSYLEIPHANMPENYHTFKGEIYQGRYVSGIAAGLKLRDLIDHHNIAPEEALVGYVGANSSAAVISGYTAFLLGIRSVCPEAVMKVKYTNTWGNYEIEKASAK
ncbi:MAG: BMP family ABC transporter substrate-binding protein [Blautia sp.]|nr:BMP family ABC transporter substrate-binding protein [Blautia sp.]